MKHRAWLGAGVAAAAVAGGVGWRIWDRLGADDATDLWRMRFPCPEGGEIDMAGEDGVNITLTLTYDKFIPKFI